ncbi:MAG: HNH endonuclease [Solirubrobacteraceae bacterium]
MTGCWELQGRRDRWGYGRITVAHRRHSVHRLAGALFLDFDLASKLYILHRCHNPPCFRPDHLRPGTHLENMRDRPPR